MVPDAVGYGSAINEKEHTIGLTKPADKNWKAALTYTRPASDQLVLNGPMDGHQVQMKLKSWDRDKFSWSIAASTGSTNTHFSVEKGAL
jgi:hypothetical protein